MKPSLDNAAKAIEKHMLVNYFLGLEPCIKANDLLKKNEHTESENFNVINTKDIEENCTLEVEEEIHNENNNFHSGYKIMSIDLDREWTKRIVHHMKICKNCTDTLHVESRKRGYELIDVHKCNWCSECFEKRCSYDVKQRKNQKSSDVNMCMSVSVYSAGININKIDELFSSIGLIAPVKTRLYEHYQKLKPHIMDLSKIELKKNRIEHSSKVRSMKDCRGDILFEKNQTKHSYSCGGVAIDGAGATRARNHRVRGDQHCLVVFSIATTKNFISNKSSNLMHTMLN